MIMKAVEITERITKSLLIYPCIKCGNDDIEIYNCGYNSFNRAGGRCNKCENKVETYKDRNVEDGALIEAWNTRNNPTLAIERLTKELKQKQEGVRKEIKRLRKIEKSYGKI